MSIFLDLLGNLQYLVGFIKSEVFLPKLTLEEEQYYLGLLFKPESHAEGRRALIEHNIRLVAHIAKKYDNSRELSEDLISIGTIGLIKAIDTFSLDKSVKLATYSAKCIENEILMTLRSNKKYNKDVSMEEVVALDKDGSEILLLDVIGVSEDEIRDAVDKKAFLLELQTYLPKLPSRELEVLTYRYGLFNVKELTQLEIAKKYGISRSYVSRIEKRALGKLLQEFKKHRDGRD